jgi:hypothetical protein
MLFKKQRDNIMTNNSENKIRQTWEIINLETQRKINFTDIQCTKIGNKGIHNKILLRL